MQDMQVKQTFDATIKGALAYRQAYTPADVDVYISGGSVVITGRVTPPAPVQSNGLMVHLKFVRQAIIDRAVDVISKMQGVNSIRSGEISATVCGIDTSRTKAWADCRTHPPMGAALTPGTPVAPVAAPVTAPVAPVAAPMVPGAAPQMTGFPGMAAAAAPPAPAAMAPVGGFLPAVMAPVGGVPPASLVDPLAGGPTLAPMESMPANVGAAVAIGMTRAENGLKRGLIGASSAVPIAPQNSNGLSLTAASIAAVTFAVFGGFVVAIRRQAENGSSLSPDE